MVYKARVEIVVSHTVIGMFQEYIKDDTLSLATSHSFYFYGNILI